MTDLFLALNNCIANAFAESTTTVIIIIIIMIHHELGLNRPVSASSNSLFKGLPSHLLPTGLKFNITYGIGNAAEHAYPVAKPTFRLLNSKLPNRPRKLNITFKPQRIDNRTERKYHNNDIKVNSFCQQIYTSVNSFSDSRSG
jgi:hypothetical protein